uniref:PSI domain-containing protein n=1 Tax=Caenorhabditis japonica TaxID=281687 RepID=A0A8R1DX76_CAEJA
MIHRLLILIVLSILSMTSVSASNMTWSQKQEYCRIGTNDLRTCETCVGKGSDCFWCAGSKKECLPFDWYYPDCDIKHVKYNVCWVSTSAAAIVIAICIGIIAVILIACFCYCCCKCKEYNRIHKKAKAQKWNEQRMTAQREMEMRQNERSEERKAHIDSYRAKYNIPEQSASASTASSSKSARKF